MVVRDFELYGYYLQPNPPPFAPGGGDYVRSGLLRGLVIEEQIGFNPYQFGLIGSTDAHSGLPTAEEPNFWGKFAWDSIPDNKLGLGDDNEGPNGWTMSASGLAAVWAEDNSRESILAAFKRREVYATTGPRIAVRVFGGAGIQPRDENARDIEAVGRAGASPWAKNSRRSRAQLHCCKGSANLDSPSLPPFWIDPPS